MSNQNSAVVALQWIAATVLVGGAALVLVTATAGYIWMQSRHAPSTNSSPFANSNSAAPVPLPLPPAPRVLLDDDVMLRDDRLNTWTFRVDGEEELRVTITLLSGETRKFTSYVFTSEEYERYQELHATLLRLGEFRHFPDFHASAARSMYGAGRMPAGEYLLMVKESSEPNAIRSADRVRVHARIEAWH